MKFPLKPLSYLTVFAMGVGAPWAWSLVFPEDSTDMLLLTGHDRIVLLPHMRMPRAAHAEPTGGEYKEDSDYRRLLHWNAATELYGYDSHASGDGQFVDGAVAGARNSLTRLQIQEIKPAFLPQYDAMFGALGELDAVLCDMRVANSGTSAFEDDPNLAAVAELMARLAHYQMAKGGRGGDAELDLRKFDQSISSSSMSSWDLRRNEYPACRRRLLDAVRRIHGLLADWDPACARLLTKHINDSADSFRR